MAVATGHGRSVDFDTNSAMCGIAAGPIMPNVAGISASATMSPTIVFCSASKGATAASARNCPRARHAWTGAHTALEFPSAFCNRSSQAIRIRLSICSGPRPYRDV